MIVETVKIVADNEWGFKVINKDKLKPTDKLYRSRRRRVKRDDKPKE